MLSSAAFAARTSHDSQARGAKFTAALVAASAIVALSVGRAVFVPMSLAAIIAFALAPVTDALRRIKLGRVASVIATVAIASAVVASIALFLSEEFATLASRELPAAKLPLLPSESMPVWIAASLAEPLLNPMTSAGVAVLFAAFLLLMKEELAERFARFAAARDAGPDASGIVEAGRVYSRHLLQQGLLDLGFGIVIALGLWKLGVPNFGLWALLGVMLRSVPFVGVPVAALCPLMLAAQVGPGALLVCETLVLFLTIDFALQFVERKWLSRAAGARLTAVAAIGATVAWTCLWGITGLLLAMPLTLGLVLLGREFPALRFLNHLVAGTPLYGEGKGGEEPRGDSLALPPEDRTLALRPWNLAPCWRDKPVLCVAGPGTMDEAAAGLLAEALKRKGLASRVIGFEDALPANLPRLALGGVQVVCISCLDRSDTPLLRQMVRRLRPRLRDAKLIAGLWGWDGEALMDAGTAECDLVTTGLVEAAERVAKLAREASDARVPAEAA